MISFSLDNYYTIWDVNQLNEGRIFKNFIKDKTFYVRFEKSNQEGLEAGLFIPHQNRVISKSKHDAILLNIDVQSDDYMFAGIQVKKDAAVTVTKYEDIIKKWQRMKKEIGDFIGNKMKNHDKPIKVKFLLFIFNESFDRKTGKVRLWNINKTLLDENVIVFFSDAKQNSSFF